MLFLRIKTVAIVIAFSLMLTMSTSLIAFTNAQTTLTGTFKTYAFINVAPNPCGKGQTAVVQFWLSTIPPNAQVEKGERWTDMTVTVKTPDGQTKNLGSFTSDATGAAHTTYTPTATGEYTFTMSFPEQEKTGEITPLFGGAPQPFDYTYLASTSNYTLVVQEEPAAAVVYPPLPSEYWTRPINAQNYGWECISGNWLMAGWDSTQRQFDQGAAYDPYGTVPASPHVLWTKPISFGGIAGGEYGSVSFYNGMSYEQFFKPPVIISGRLYYNTIGANEPINSITCVDMATGQTLYTISNATLSFGQLLNFVSPNQGGTFAYLWDTSAGTTWKMYDAWTGQYILSIDNVPSGTVLLDNTFYTDAGPGDILVYSLTSNQLTLWNSTQVFQTLIAQLQQVIAVAYNVWEWRPYTWAGQTLNGTLGIQWTEMLSNMPVGGTIAQVGYDNTVYVYNTTVASTETFGFPPVSSWSGYSMTDGSYLWGPTTIDTRTKLPEDSIGYAGVGILQHQGLGSGGILPVFDRDTEQMYAWNVKTGQFLWGPTEALTNPLGMYNWEITWIVNGILYNSGYDGMVHAYNATNGDHLWDFSSGDAGTITPYGTWPLYNGLTIVGPADNSALIATTGEHGNGVMPLYQGEGLYVLNAVTGTQLWNVTGWFCQPAFSDGMMVTQNLYDNQIYCFGKGPSATTVTASPKISTHGDEVLVEGMVTDISAGTSQTEQAARFPHGVPVVSDASMNAWMGYVYQQQPMPTDVTGVNVTISVLDPNNNEYEVGTATTNIDGTYGLTFTPKVPGKYLIVATFAGSGSYYLSYATTYVSVSEATTTPTPTPVPEAPVGTYFAISTALIIVVIVLVAILILRKR